MTRNPEHPITRLRRRVWIHLVLVRFKREVDAGNIPARVLPPPTDDKLWDWLASELLGDAIPNYAGDEQASKGVRGVADKGNNPRALSRLVEKEEASASQYGEVVERRRPGPVEKGGENKGGKIEYYKIPIDLVAVVEQILPGSAAWETAVFWQFATDDLPDLESLRRTIRGLIGSLDLCRPSLDERQQYFSDETVQALRSLSLEEKIRRYRDSLAPLVEDLSACSLSLLSALTLESFIADNKSLFDIHRNATWNAIQKLLTPDLMKNVRVDFRQVSTSILSPHWGSTLQWPTSIDAPLMPVKDWEEVSGMKLFHLDA